MSSVCDGGREADERIRRVFVTDPGLDVLRHADAGYEKTQQMAKQAGLRIPQLK